MIKFDDFRGNYLRSKGVRFAPHLMFVLLVTGCVRNTAESECKHSEFNRSSSKDGKYSVIVEKIVCVAGAETSYEMKITSPTVGNVQGFLVSIPLEHDSSTPEAPSVTWSTDRVVRVEIPTRTITGELKSDFGKNFRVYREYVPSVIPKSADR